MDQKLAAALKGQRRAWRSAKTNVAERAVLDQWAKKPLRLNVYVMRDGKYEQFLVE